MFKHVILAAAILNAACLYLIFAGRMVPNNFLIGSWAGYFIVSMVLIFFRELFLEKNSVAIQKLKQEADLIINDKSLTAKEKQAKLLTVMVNQGENNE